MQVPTAARPLFLAAALGLALAGLWSVAIHRGRVPDAEETELADDGWRRTGFGWEHTDDWSPEANDSLRAHFLYKDSSQQAPPLWDFHPAWLAVIQLSAVASAFLVWPKWPRR